MTADRIFNAVGFILTIAMVTVILSNKRFAADVTAVGRAGTNFLAQAMGNPR